MFRRKIYVNIGWFDDNSLLNKPNTSDSECACEFSGSSMGEISRKCTDISATPIQMSSTFKDKGRAEDWLLIGVIYDDYGLFFDFLV